MTTHISGTDGVDLIQDGTLVAADIKTGQTVGMPLMQLFTAQATTSGTVIDFTGIPNWAKRITLMLNGVSVSGTSNYLVQLGAGAVQTTGYICASTRLAAATLATNGSTSGFMVNTASAAASVSGSIVLSLISSNLWAASFAAGDGAQSYSGGGSVTLSGTLDRIRLTTVNGTDTFDAGSVNILVEGYQ